MFTYFTLVDHDAQHASSFPDRDVAEINFPPLPQFHRLIKAVIELGERHVTLFMTESVYIGVYIGVEIPGPHGLGARVDVTGRLPPYGP
jgi:hypothetical protein